MTEKEARRKGTSSPETTPTENAEAPTTRTDPLDLGAPMAPGEGPQGPEDALEPDQESLRGDYSGRTGAGDSYQTMIVGYRADGTPIIEAVKQS